MRARAGLPPDSVVDSEEKILKDSERYSEISSILNPGAMIQYCLGALFAIQCDRRIDEAKVLSWRANMAFICIRTWRKPRMKKSFCLKMFGHRPVLIWNRSTGSGRMYGLPIQSMSVQEEIEVYAHDRLRCGPLSILEYAPGFRDCTPVGIHEGWCESWVGCGWFS